jgi:hypothetical protein
VPGVFCAILKVRCKLQVGTRRRRTDQLPQVVDFAVLLEGVKNGSPFGECQRRRGRLDKYGSPAPYCSRTICNGRFSSHRPVQLAKANTPREVDEMREEDWSCEGRRLREQKSRRQLANHTYLTPEYSLTLTLNLRCFVAASRRRQNTTTIWSEIEVGKLKLTANTNYSGGKPGMEVMSFTEDHTFVTSILHVRNIGINGCILKFLIVRSLAIR